MERKKTPDGDEKASTVEEEKAEVRKDILFNNDAVIRIKTESFCDGAKPYSPPPPYSFSHTTVLTSRLFPLVPLPRSTAVATNNGICYYNCFSSVLYKYISWCSPNFVGTINVTSRPTINFIFIVMAQAIWERKREKERRERKTLVDIFLKFKFQPLQWLLEVVFEVSSHQTKPTRGCQ